ncbi:MAG: hypothetical protein V3T70_07385, partial [Phycisphaerae bacterium]
GRVRDALSSDELTDEQKRIVVDNMREAREESMNERVDEYFSASEADKPAILDRQIDEFQKRREEWERRRREREASEKDGDADEENDRDQFRRFFGSQTQEERKSRSEGRNPDYRARRMSYFRDMRERMQQRGIEMPRWGGGRGRGGGRGGSGPR